MNKKGKNTIIIFLILLSLIMMVITLNYAKNHLENDDISTDFRLDNKGKDETDRLFDEEISDEDKKNFDKGDMKGTFNKGEIKEPLEDDFKIDGGFGGSGETNVKENIKLTIPYIIFVCFWSTIISLSLTYLVISNLKKKKLSKNKILICILLNIIMISTLTFIIVYFGNNYYLNNEKIQYSSTDDLHINMRNWSYDSTNNVYYQIGIVYVSNPVDVKYESLGIYVPGDYMDCESTKNDKYTCTLNTENKVGEYTSTTAPIVMPMNTGGYAAQASPVSYSYNGLSEYLNAGFIYVYSGCRGKNNESDYDGGAPWGVTDFKAAIRYLRYNENVLPGNTESIFVFGMSGGGAQSTLVGTTGDSELYTPYLESIGAIISYDNGEDISDAVAGIMAWCPITSLDFASEAYEWNMGQFMSTGTRKESTWTSALSSDMADAYANYINALKLVDEKGNVLKLTASETGIYTSGSYYDYLLGIIETSLNNYLTDNYSSIEEMQKYVDSLNTDTNWVVFNEKNKTVSISSIEDFVIHCKKATKDVGAFDDLNKTQAENYVFGNGQNDALHFDFTMANLLLENEDKYSKYSDYDTKYKEEYNNDIKNVDTLGNSSIYRQNMYNPMYYLSSYYEGYETSNVSKYWRIRSGIAQGDTALTVETNLALALEQNKNVTSVDFATVWDEGHTMAERTGNSTTNFIDWINECLKEQ